MSESPTTNTITGNPRTDWFVHSRFGLFIHWGLYAIPARGEWVQNRERIPASQYQRYFDRFCPDLYDPREWASAARDAGMEYMVVTTKHHDGFCLWDTEYTEFKATRAPWGKDLLLPLVEAFREKGLKVGFYYSLLDWNHPDFPVDRHHPQRDDEGFRAAAKGRDVCRYSQFMRDQVSELLTRYGPVDIMWFDFSYPGEDGKGRDEWESERLVKLVRKLQPQALINNRLDLPETADFVTPEQFQPDSIPRDENGQPVLWEGCQTFSGAWGYHRDEQSWKSVRQLLVMLIDSVSKNGNILLNVGPTARGEFDWRASERLAGIGAWMRHHRRSIRGCGPAPDGLAPPEDTRYTYNPENNRLYVHLIHWPFKHLHLPGLAGKAHFAQLLHDGSEILTRTEESAVHTALNAPSPKGALTLELPTLKPKVDIPVIEIFLG